MKMQMIRPLLGRSMREWPRLTIVMTVLFVLLAWATISYFPTFEAATRGVDRIQHWVPKGESWDWLRQKLQFTLLAGFEGFIGAAHFWRGLTIMGSFLAVLLGAWALAWEYETGTVAILFSRPAPRWLLSLWLYGSGLLCLWLIVLVNSLAVPPMAGWILDRYLDPWHALGAGLLAGSVLTLVYSYSFLISSVSYSLVRSLLMSGGVTLFFIMASLFAGFRKISFYYHVDFVEYGGIMLNGSPPLGLVGCFLAASALLVLLAVQVTRFRDY